MNRGTINTKRPLAAALAVAGAMLFGATANAQDGAGIVGQNDWLYYRYDFTDASEQPAVDKSVRLFSALSGLLEANGTQMVLAVVPAKVRVYPQHLPTDRALTPFLAAHYGTSLAALRGAGVDAVDLEQPFLAHAAKPDAELLFMRLDSHWSQSGALLAAETIAAHAAAQPDVQAVAGALPARAYTLQWNPTPQTLPLGDLTGILPPGTPTYAPEQARVFTVTAPAGGDLLAENATPGIALMGSSFSGAWTGFPDALRYALQRDVASVSVAADRGHWVGLELFLRDDGFQMQAPKLLVVEIPERGLAAPPSYPYREARYVIDESQWLRRAAAWITRVCQAAGTVGAGEVAGRWALQPQGDAYLSASLAVSGPNQISLAWRDASGATTTQSLEVQGDGAWHALRLPLPEGADIAALTVSASGATLLQLEDVTLCRMPALPALSP
jgi:alginate O-acetyltransferase complex protein AlgJ